MLTISRRSLLLVACFLAAAAPDRVPGADDQPATGPDAIRVLIIGNSQMYYNNLPDILEKLAEAAPQDRRRIKTGRVLNGGYTLEKHWNEGDGKDAARGMIMGGNGISSCCRNGAGRPIGPGRLNMPGCLTI